MNKQARTLLILGVILMVMIGAYIGVSAYKNAQAQKEAEAAKAAELYAGKRGDPVSIDYTSDGATLSFIQEEGIWYVTDNKAFPLNQDDLTQIATALTSLTAVRTLDAPSPLSAYGLDAPEYTLKAADSAGNTFSLSIGDEYNGNYYAVTGDDATKVYTIGSTLVGYLETDLLNLLALDTIPSLTGKTLESVTLTEPSASLYLTNAGGTDGTSNWSVVTGDTSTPADDVVLAEGTDKTPSELISGVETALKAASFSSAAAYQPTTDALKAYGLDVPQLSVAVEYSSTDTGTEETTTAESVTFEVGLSLDDGSGYYARLSGSDQVCVLSSSVVEPLSEALTAMGTPS